MKYLPWIVGILAIISIFLAYQSHLKIKSIEAALTAKKDCGCSGANGNGNGIVDDPGIYADPDATGGVMS